MAESKTNFSAAVSSRPKYCLYKHWKSSYTSFATALGNTKPASVNIISNNVGTTVVTLSDFNFSRSLFVRLYSSENSPVLIASLYSSYFSSILSSVVSNRDFDERVFFLRYTFRNLLIAFGRKMTLPKSNTGLLVERPALPIRFLTESVLLSSKRSR